MIIFIQMICRFRKDKEMRFKRIYIEITNTCNLACSFCIQNQRVPRKLSVEEFEHIINEIKPYTDYVYLHILGEPLSHPDLGAFLDICEQADLQVNITTNGTLLKAKEELLLSHRIRQINVSLHSFPEHVQPHYFEDVCSVSEKLARQGVHISYRLWSVKDGVLSEESKVLLEKIMKHYAIPEIKDFEKRMRMKLQDYLYLNMESVFEWPSLNHSFVSDVGRCLGMKHMCGILSDGTITACCLDSKGDIALGNIFKESFSSIIQSDRVIAMCDGFSNQIIKEELCKHCSYRLRFNK